MKKTICLLLAALMLLSLCACGGQKVDNGKAEQTAADGAPAGETAPAEETATAASVGDFKTMGDVLVYDSDNSGFSDEYYVYAFEKDGVAYRAVAELPAEVSEALWELDIFDEDYDAKLMEAVGPLEITQLDNLTEMIPAQEELDALVGANVQELLDEGWSFWYWNMEVMEGGMYHGPFSFMMEYEGTVEDPENFDESQAGALTVKSVTYDGIGDVVADVLDAGNEGESDLTWNDDDESLEDGQNPVMNFVGEYQSDRAHALVECTGSDGALITIDWGGSAWETAQWVISGVLDLDTLTLEYADGVKSILTYDDDGALVSEETEYEDGTGTIVFNDDGTFTWHDDQSEYGEDMVFEWTFNAE